MDQTAPSLARAGLLAAAIALGGQPPLPRIRRSHVPLSITGDRRSNLEAARHLQRAHEKRQRRQRRNLDRLICSRKKPAGYWPCFGWLPIGSLPQRCRAWVPVYCEPIEWQYNEQTRQYQRHAWSLPAGYCPSCGTSTTSTGIVARQRARQ